MRPLGVGIVGCGAAALDLARAAHELDTTVVTAAYDIRADQASALAARHGGTVYPDLDTLLADAAVDLVYIGLPHHLLAPTAHRVLSTGRHALVEKPVGTDEESVAALRRLAADRDRRLGVMFELREAGAVREARRLITGGAIGAVRAVRIRTLIDKPQSYWWVGPDAGTGTNWRARRASAGGGVVLMNSIHQIDTVRHVTGQRFVRALAEVAAPTPPVEVEDVAAAVLRLSGGAVVSLTAAAHSPGAAGEETIEIDGEFGRLDLDPYGPGRLRLFPRRPWAGLAAGVWHPIEVEAVDTHRALLRRFVEAVETGTPPSADGADAAAALATVLAIYRSADTGCAVAVPDEPGRAAEPAPGPRG